MEKLKPPYYVTRKTHTCTFCKKEFVWGKESEWYGSYTIHNPGAGAYESEDVIAKACSAPCVKAMRKVYPLEQ